MRYILLSLILIVSIHSNANDTLTRAQVYNYNIGDTFDYQYYSYFYNAGDYPPTQISISYYRIIISNIFWSSDSLTKYIVQDQIYPVSSIDTLVLTNLYDYEVFVDTDWAVPSTDTIIISPLPDFFNRPTNLLAYQQNSGWPPPLHRVYFAPGLGCVLNYQYGYYYGYRSDSTILIYYSGDSGTYGTPYTAFPNGINDLTDLNKGICLYPTVNNGSFTIDVSRNSQLPIDFSLFDITGKQTKQLSIINHY